MARGPGRDRDAIRQAILRAAGELVESNGLESLTFRRVAAAADVSPGRVQHYFADRTSLVHACFDEVQDRARSRVEASLTTVEPTPANVIAAVLRAMIPRNRDELRAMRVVAMFENLALTEPTLGRSLQEGHAQLRQLLTEQVTLALAGERTDAHAKSGPEIISCSLLALAEGLAGEVLHGHLGPDAADRVLGAALSCSLDKRSDNSKETSNEP